MIVIKTMIVIKPMIVTKNHDSDKTHYSDKTHDSDNTVFCVICSIIYKEREIFTNLFDLLLSQLYCQQNVVHKNIKMKSLAKL